MTSEKPDVLVSVRNVTKRFGGLVANRDVTMDIFRGEILAMIGPNGAGKSTMFNMIAGAFPPTSGQIFFEGIDITNLSANAKCSLGIGRTFQVPRSFESMSVVENVMVGAFVRHPKASDARRAAWETLEFVGLSSRGDSPQPS
jgi:branched-chain amino acid transport system ATP-binding protein